MTGYVRVDTSNNIADGNVISAADLDNEFDGIQAAFNASTGHNHDGTTGEGAPILVLGPTQDVVVGSSTVTPKTTNTVDIGSSSLKFKDLFLAGNASIGGTLAVTGVATLTANPVMSGGTANGVAYLNGSKVLTTGSALTFDGSTFQSDTSGFRIGKSPADSPSANIYASVIADVNQTSELWIGANTASVVGGSFLSGLGFYNTDNTTPGANLSGIKAYIKDSTGSMYLNFYAGNTYYAANTPQYTIDPAYHAWFSGTTEGMRLTSTGLGIGTSSPAYRLDVVESADSEVSLRVSNQNTGANSIASLYLHGQGNNFFIRNYGDGTSNANKTDFISAAGSSYFTFSPANAERMRIDSSGNLGLGVTPSAWATLKAVQLPGGAIAGYAGGTGNNQFSLLNNAYYDGTNYDYIVTDTAQMYRTTGGTHQWHNAPSGTAGTAITFSERMRLSAAGGLSIGTTTDPGAGGLITTGNVTLGDATTDTVTVNGYVGVGGAAQANIGLYIRNTALSNTAQYGVYNSVTGTSSATSAIAAYVSAPATAAAAFTAVTVYGFLASNATLGAGSTITNLHGLYIVDQTQGTNNYGITSLVSSGSNKWNIYASGTAQNYFAGDVGVGTTTPSQALVVLRNTGASGLESGFSITNNVDSNLFLRVTGTGATDKLASIATTVATALTFSTNSTERLRITSAGNVGIGTSSPQNTLDVVGTSRFVGNTSIYSSTGGAVNSSTLTFGSAALPAAASVYGKTDTATAGNLVFATAQTGTGTMTERLRIDSSGNLGLGVTPSAWGSSNKAVQLPGGAVWAFSTTQITLGQNVLDTGSGTFVYVNSAEATRYRQLAGSHAWFTAPSGTAGAAITFTQAVTLSSSGNLGIGTTSPVSRLDVADATSAIITLTRTDSTSGNGVIRSVGNTNVTNAAIALGGGVNNHITFTTVTSERLRIDSSGNVQTLTGAQVVWAPAPASISTTATLTNANIQGQIINTTGTSYTVTMPLGTTLETLVSWSNVDLGYNFTVINTASGTITMAVNTGVTSLGGLTIATGVSAQFRIRRTAANTFILYRLS